jgi:hypothetical protein
MRVVAGIEAVAVAIAAHDSGDAPSETLTMGDHPMHLASGIGLRLSRMPKPGFDGWRRRWPSAQSLRQGDRRPMTLLWFAIWLVFNLVGDSEPLTFDPVNWWAGTLILAIALDLARAHAPRIVRSRD